MNFNRSKYFISRLKIRVSIFFGDIKLNKIEQLKSNLKLTFNKQINQNQ